MVAPPRSGPRAAYSPSRRKSSMSRSPLNGRFSTVLAAASLAALAACSDAPVPVSPVDAPSSATQARASATSYDVVPGEVIVKFKDGVDVESVARSQGVAHARFGYAHRFDVVLTSRGNERSVAARLATDPNVEYAEPNYLRHVNTIDSRLWAFYNPGGLYMSFYNDANGRTGPLPSTYTSVADADEDNIEGYAAGGADVIIGSIDTGVDFSHPEFTGRLIAGKDWYDNDNDPSDTPDEGHGTHTTGTMAGSTVGVAGVSGAAPHVRVYVQRVCGAAGCPTSAIVNAINAAADYTDASGNHLVAVNMSLGGGDESI